jgi:hypothetical protein
MKYQGSVAFSGSRRAEAISIPTLDRADIIDDGWDSEGAVEDLPEPVRQVLPFAIPKAGMG